ncbi:hypothetical protein [Catenulispora pinisilvae]|uniref:hypothetical protein n=1 Tax=Catenulispora pinisilvae TaxID=2705253 RepID=UPI00189182C0|nr:hypothetical protein [Catenulispora pinisilvae]
MASAVVLVVCTLIGSARADVAASGSAPTAIARGAGIVATIPAPAPPPPPAPSPSPVPGIYGPLVGGGSMAPPPPVSGSFGSERSDPSWWDIPGQIEKAIDTWLGDLVKSALDPVLHLVTSSLLSSPDLSSGRVASIWTSVAILSNTLYVLFILAGGVIVLVHGGLEARSSIKEIAPRLVIGIIASNASLWLICQSVSLGNALVGALMNGKVSAEGVGSRLTTLIVYEVFLPGGIGELFLVVIGGVIAALGVALVVTGLVRATALMVLAAGAPLAFACHALPQTEGLAKLWWRAIAGCLATQVVQALVLVVCIQVFFDPNADTELGLPTSGGLTDLLICLVLFFLLIKIPVWTGRIVLNRSAFGPTRATSLARNYLQYRAFGAVTSRFDVGRRRPRPGGETRLPPPPPTSPGGGPGHGKFGPLPPLPGEPRRAVPPQPSANSPDLAVADRLVSEPSRTTRVQPAPPRPPTSTAKHPKPTPARSPTPPGTGVPPFRNSPTASAPRPPAGPVTKRVKPPAVPRETRPTNGIKPQIRPLTEG